jgi:hypothetical protein
MTTVEQRAEWLEQLGGLNEDNIAGLMVGGVIRALIADIEELEAKVVVAEKERDDAEFELWYTPGLHIITDEQIDMAVEDANRWPEKFGWSWAMWELLGKLSIVRCTWKSKQFECVDGKTMTLHPPKDYVSIPQCPKCHGRGWVREERGDG